MQGHFFEQASLAPKGIFDVLDVHWTRGGRCTTTIFPRDSALDGSRTAGPSAKGDEDDKQMLNVLDEFREEMYDEMREQCLFTTVNLRDDDDNIKHVGDSDTPLDAARVLEDGVWKVQHDTIWRNHVVARSCSSS